MTLHSQQTNVTRLLLRRKTIVESRETRAFVHSLEEHDFMPVIPLDYIRDTEEREAAEKLVCAMRPHLIELVDERLWLEWATLKSKNL